MILRREMWTNKKPWSSCKCAPWLQEFDRKGDICRYMLARKRTLSTEVAICKRKEELALYEKIYSNIHISIWRSTYVSLLISSKPVSQGFRSSGVQGFSSKPWIFLESPSYSHHNLQNKNRFEIEIRIASSCQKRGNWCLSVKIHHNQLADLHQILKSGNKNKKVKHRSHFLHHNTDATVLQRPGRPFRFISKAVETNTVK